MSYTMKKNERNYKKYLQPEHKLKIHNAKVSL